MRKTAVITGASRGIGRSIAFMLAKNKYNIVLAAKTTEQELDKLPSTIYLVESDIKKLYPDTIFYLLRQMSKMKHLYIN